MLAYHGSHVCSCLIDKICLCDLPKGWRHDPGLPKGKVHGKNPWQATFLPPQCQTTIRMNLSQHFPL